MGFRLTPRSMTLDDLELLEGQIILALRDISSPCFGGNNS